jgi:endonuclease/exonuclease/phosphatase (EEP) superfamily protein YafD
MRRLSPILAGLAALAVLLVLAQQLVRAQTGPLPLAGVFEVHLLALAAVAALLAIPGALGGERSRAWSRLVIVGTLVVVVVRLGGELWSPDPVPAAEAGGADPATAVELRVLTWNLELGSKAAGTSVAGILAADADLVALQELTPEVATAIEADPELGRRYPYRILEPADGVDGMGLLASLPLVVRGAERDPLILRAGLVLPDHALLELFDVHPYPPGIRTVEPIPVSLDTRRRDEELGVIGARVAALDEPAAALVLGDLNTAPTEPAFGSVAAGLVDSHAVAGLGPGFTWRPSALEGLHLGLLRIDHVLAGARLTPTASAVDCSLPGDHCRLVVTLQVAPRAP